MTSYNKKVWNKILRGQENLQNLTMQEGNTRPARSTLILYEKGTKSACWSYCIYLYVHSHRLPKLVMYKIKDGCKFFDFPPIKRWAPCHLHLKFKGLCNCLTNGIQFLKEGPKRGITSTSCNLKHPFWEYRISRNKF